MEPLKVVERGGRGGTGAPREHGAPPSEEAQVKISAASRVLRAARGTEVQGRGPRGKVVGAGWAQVRGAVRDAKGGVDGGSEDKEEKKIRYAGRGVWLPVSCSSVCASGCLCLVVSRARVLLSVRVCAHMARVLLSLKIGRFNSLRHGREPVLRR